MTKATILRISILIGAGSLSACAGEGAADDDVAQPAAQSELTESGRGMEVPPGKVLLPGGRIADSSCVQEIPDKATVDENGDVWLNGKLHARNKPCTPEQMGEGRQNDKKVQAPTISHAWVEFSEAGSATFFNKMRAKWVVPPAPTSNLNKIIYLFPSFQSSWNGGEIIQPVLQYGGNGQFGGNYWVIASWYCYPNGCKHSGAKNVNAGDQLLGAIDLTGSTATTKFYQISSYDLTQGTVTTLPINTNGPFNRAEGGALEVYSVSTCAQYPATTAVSFTNIEVYEPNPTWNTTRRVHPAWGNIVTGGLTPSCGYSVTSGLSGADDFTNLFFHN